MMCYGEDFGECWIGFQKLIEQLLVQMSVFWICFMYVYLMIFDEGLFEFMGQEECVVFYFDMLLQYSYFDIFKGMCRGGSVMIYFWQFEKVCCYVLDVFLCLIFIMGFLGELEVYFQYFLDFVWEVWFDYLGVFVFSLEFDIFVMDFFECLSWFVVIEWCVCLLEVQEEILFVSWQRFVGRILEVFVQGVCFEFEYFFEGCYVGQVFEVDGCVLINDGVVLVGIFVEVEISEVFVDDVVGYVVGLVDGLGVVFVVVMGQV